MYSLIPGSQELPYKTAHELAARLLGVSLSASTLYRLTMQYGQALEPLLAETFPVAAHEQPVVYAMADGLMLLFDEGYKEIKLGRLFPAAHLKTSSVAQRGGSIEQSLYLGRVGSCRLSGRIGSNN